MLARLAVMISACSAAHIKEYVDYSAGGVASRGFISYDDTICTAQSKCPGVLVVQDWNGMNQYEMDRACDLAAHGYVAFAADIYGTAIVDSWNGSGNFQNFIAASTAHRQNATLYMSNIMGALTTMTSYDFVESSKLAAIGYCFGGTGVINLATTGHGGQYSVPNGLLGTVAFHAGGSGLIMPTEGSTATRPRLLIHHGVADESQFPNATMAMLEEKLESVSAPYEVQRYGSDVGHGFTEWHGQAYNAAADRVSWRSTTNFLSDLFMSPASPTAPPAPASPIEGSLVNYTAAGANCTGYLIYNTSLCSSSSKCPGVLVIQDWDGMTEYEQQRAHLLANMGFVAFAADIYGREITGNWTGGANAFGEYGAASNIHRSDATLYMGKIMGALTVMSSYAFVDTSKLAAIGYCFGGTGAMNLAIAGHGGSYAIPTGLLGVVAYHAGSGGLLQPGQATSRPKLALHQGIADPMLPLSIVTKLEGEMEAVSADFDITWYGSDVGHSFTHWGGPAYHAIADARSWQATEAFLKDLFNGVTAGSTEPAQCSVSSTSTTGFLSSLPSTTVSSTSNIQVNTGLAVRTTRALSAALMILMSCLASTRVFS
jgi:dienelactone hydrolase